MKKLYHYIDNKDGKDLIFRIDESNYEIYLEFFPKIRFHLRKFSNTCPEKIETIWQSREFNNPNEIDYHELTNDLAKVNSIFSNQEIRKNLPKRLMSQILLQEHLFFKAHNKPLDFLDEVLETTVKCDRPQRRMVILGMVSAYCPNPINIFVKHETSTGKSHLVVEAAKLFPKEDVWQIATASPTAFIHQKGELDQEKNAIIIDMRRRIVIFLDQPNDLLLERLKPVLSHDAPEIEFLITDRTKKSSLRTKRVIIKGWPAFIYISVQQKTEQENATRGIHISPEDSTEKVRLVLEYQTETEKNPYKWEKERSQDFGLWLARDLIYRIRELGHNISITKPYLNEVKKKFIEKYPLTTRAMRDYPKFLSIIDAATLLNHESREKIQHEDGTLEIISDVEDSKTAFKVFGEFAISLQLGLSPAITDFYNKILKPLYQENEEPIDIQLIGKSYFDIKKRALGPKYLRNYYLEPLINAGLVIPETDVNDRRKTLYSIDNRQKKELRGVCTFYSELEEGTTTPPSSISRKKEFDIICSNERNLILEVIDKLNKERLARKELIIYELRNEIPSKRVKDLILQLKNEGIIYESFLNTYELSES